MEEKQRSVVGKRFVVRKLSGNRQIGLFVKYDTKRFLFLLGEFTFFAFSDLKALYIFRGEVGG